MDLSAVGRAAPFLCKYVPPAIDCDRHRRLARLQMSEWNPSLRYPDPAVETFDKRFDKPAASSERRAALYWSALERGTGLVRGRSLFIVERRARRLHPTLG